VPLTSWAQAAFREIAHDRSILKTTKDTSGSETNHNIFAKRAVNEQNKNKQTTNQPAEATPLRTKKAANSSRSNKSATAADKGNEQLHGQRFSNQRNSSSASNDSPHHTVCRSEWGGQYAPSRHELRAVVRQRHCKDRALTLVAVARVNLHHDSSLIGVRQIAVDTHRGDTRALWHPATQFANTKIITGA
jgi:hypothetical protein